MKKSIGILGGGISGISLAYFLPKNKYSISLLEKEGRIGGLAKSFHEKGFTFDVGPHIIFAKDKKILRWMCQMLGKDDRKLYRSNFTYYKGRYVKYPFENGLGMLPPEDTYECLYHFLFNEHKGLKPKNFKEWMYVVFGKGIAEKYLIPYNTKIWKTDPKNLSLEWVGGRVPQPPPEDIIKSALGINTEGYQEQLYFHYPRRGGIEKMLLNILAKAKAKHGQSLSVETGREISRISKKDGKWIVTDSSGNSRKFDILINTMPIHIFNKVSAFLNSRINRDIERLRYNSLILIFIGYRSSQSQDKFAVYFPQSDILFHRISFNNYLSPSMSPRGTASITAEITFREGDKISRLTDKNILKHVVGVLEREKIIPPKAIIYTSIKREKYEYPVYDFNYAPCRKRIYREFSRIKNFHWCGRFAEFRYINTNDCIKSAMEIAKKL